MIDMTAREQSSCLTASYRRYTVGILRQASYSENQPWPGTRLVAIKLRMPVVLCQRFFNNFLDEALAVAQISSPLINDMARRHGDSLICPPHNLRLPASKTYSQRLAFNDQLSWR